MTKHFAPIVTPGEIKLQKVRTRLEQSGWTPAKPTEQPGGTVREQNAFDEPGVSKTLVRPGSSFNQFGNISDLNLGFSSRYPSPMTQYGLNQRAEPGVSKTLNTPRPVTGQSVIRATQRTGVDQPYLSEQARETYWTDKGRRDPTQFFNPLANIDAPQRLTAIGQLEASKELVQQETVLGLAASVSRAMGNKQINEITQEIADDWQPLENFNDALTLLKDEKAKGVPIQDAITKLQEKIGEPFPKYWILAELAAEAGFIAISGGVGTTLTSSARYLPRGLKEGLELVGFIVKTPYLIEQVIDPVVAASLRGLKRVSSPVLDYAARAAIGPGGSRPDRRFGTQNPFERKLIDVDQVEKPTTPKPIQMLRDLQSQRPDDPKPPVIDILPTNVVTELNHILKSTQQGVEEVSKLPEEFIKAPRPLTRQAREELRGLYKKYGSQQVTEDLAMSIKAGRLASDAIDEMNDYYELTGSDRLTLDKVQIPPDSVNLILRGMEDLIDGVKHEIELDLEIEGYQDNIKEFTDRNVRIIGNRVFGSPHTNNPATLVREFHQSLDINRSVTPMGIYNDKRAISLILDILAVRHGGSPITQHDLLRGDDIGMDDRLGMRLDVDYDDPAIGEQASLDIDAMESQAFQILGLEPGPQQPPIPWRGAQPGMLNRTRREMQESFIDLAAADPQTAQNLGELNPSNFLRPIKTGVANLRRRLQLEVNLGRFPDLDAADTIDQFLTLLPSNYLDDLGSSYFTFGNDPDASGRAVAGFYKTYTSEIRDDITGAVVDINNIALISIAKDLLAAIGQPERLVIHEIAHHLEQFVPAKDARKLVRQWKIERATKGKTVLEEAELIEEAALERARAKRRRTHPGKPVDDATLRLQYTAKEKAKLDSAYRYTNFREYFAEIMTDKALRDIYKRRDDTWMSVIEKVERKIREIAVAIRDWFRRLGRANEAERIYQRLMKGEYSVLDRRNLGDVAAPSITLTGTRNIDGGGGTPNLSGARIISFVDPETQKQHDAMRKIIEGSSASAMSPDDNRNLVPLGAFEYDALAGPRDDKFLLAVRLKLISDTKLRKTEFGKEIWDEYFKTGMAEKYATSYSADISTRKKIAAKMMLENLLEAFLETGADKRSTRSINLGKSEIFRVAGDGQTLIFDSFDSLTDFLTTGTYKHASINWGTISKSGRAKSGLPELVGGPPSRTKVLYTTPKDQPRFPPRITGTSAAVEKSPDEIQKILRKKYPGEVIDVRPRTKKAASTTVPDSEPGVKPLTPEPTTYTQIQSGGIDLKTMTELPGTQIERPLTTTIRQLMDYENGLPDSFTGTTRTTPDGRIVASVKDERGGDVPQLSWAVDNGLITIVDPDLNNGHSIVEVPGAIDNYMATGLVPGTKKAKVDRDALELKEQKRRDDLQRDKTEVVFVESTAKIYDIRDKKWLTGAKELERINNVLDEMEEFGFDVETPREELEKWSEITTEDFGEAAVLKGDELKEYNQARDEAWNDFKDSLDAMDPPEPDLEEDIGIKSARTTSNPEGLETGARRDLDDKDSLYRAPQQNRMEAYDGVFLVERPEVDHYLERIEGNSLAGIDGKKRRGLDILAGILGNEPAADYANILRRTGQHTQMLDDLDISDAFIELRSIENLEDSLATLTKTGYSEYQLEGVSKGLLNEGRDAQDLKTISIYKRMQELENFKIQPQVINLLEDLRDQLDRIELNNTVIRNFDDVNRGYFLDGRMPNELYEVQNLSNQAKIRQLLNLGTDIERPDFRAKKRIWASFGTPYENRDLKIDFDNNTFRRYWENTGWTNITNMSARVSNDISMAAYIRFLMNDLIPEYIHRTNGTYIQSSPQADNFPKLKSQTGEIGVVGGISEVDVSKTKAIKDIATGRIQNDATGEPLTIEQKNLEIKAINQNEANELLDKPDLELKEDSNAVGFEGSGPTYKLVPTYTFIYSGTAKKGANAGKQMGWIREPIFWKYMGKKGVRRGLYTFEEAQAIIKEKNDNLEKLRLADGGKTLPQKIADSSRDLDEKIITNNAGVRKIEEPLSSEDEAKRAEDIRNAIRDEKLKNEQDRPNAYDGIKADIPEIDTGARGRGGRGGGRKPPTAVSPGGPQEPLPDRPKTLADLEREARGIKALTPAERAALMDEKRPLQNVDYEPRPFDQHGDNLLLDNSPFMQKVREYSLPSWTDKITGVVTKSIGVFSPAQLARSNPIHMIGIKKGIWLEIETQRARLWTLRWWSEAEKVLGYKMQTSTKIPGIGHPIWKAEGVKYIGPSNISPKVKQTIDDIVDHPERYEITPEQEALINQASDTMTNLLRVAQRAGVDVTEMESNYWHRIVLKSPPGMSDGQKSNWFKTARTSSRKGYTKSRAFEDIDMAIDQGWVYETNPVTRLFARIEAGLQTIADQNVRIKIQNLPGMETITQRRERLYPEAIDRAKRARAERDEAVKLYRKDKTRENFDILQRAEVNYVKARSSVYNARVEPGFGELKLPNGRIADAAIVEQVKKFIDLPELQDRGSQLSATALELSQMIRLIVTNVDFAAGFIQGQGAIFRNPAIWLKAQVYAGLALVDDPTSYVAKNYKHIDFGIEMGHIVAPTEHLFASHGLSALPLQIPVIGPAMKGFNRAFEWYMTVAQTEFSKAATSKWAKKNLGSSQQDMLDDLVHLGQTLRTQMGTESYAILGVRPNQRTIEALTFFAPRFLRAIAKVPLNVFTGRGSTRREAIQFIGSLIGGAVLITEAINRAQNKNPDRNNLLPYTNVSDPFSPDYLTFTVGDEQKHLLGPFYTLIRLFHRSSLHIANGDSDKVPMELQRYLRSKGSIPIQMLDLFGQFAFKGEAQNFDGQIADNKADLAKMLLHDNVPISVGQAFEPTITGDRTGAIEAARAMNFIGLSGNNSPYTQMNALFRMDSQINPKRIAYRDAEKHQKDAMAEKYPAVAEAIIEAGRGLYGKANREKSRIDDEALSAEEALQIQMDQKWDPIYFKKQYAVIRKASWNQQQGVHNAFNLFQDDEMPEDPNEVAIWEHYQTYDDSIDWDLFDSLLAEKENNWTAEQTEFVERNTIPQFHTKLSAKYHEDREILEPYFSIGEDYTFSSATIQNAWNDYLDADNSAERKFIERRVPALSAVIKRRTNERKYMLLTSTDSDLETALIMWHPSGTQPRTVQGIKLWIELYDYTDTNESNLELTGLGEQRDQLDDISSPSSLPAAEPTQRNTITIPEENLVLSR